MANYKLTTRAIKDKDGNKVGEKKCIIVDTEKVTPADEKIIEMYVKTGNFEIYPKKKAKKTGKGLTAPKMRKYLQDNDKDALKEFETMLKQKENFMNIMTWFKGVCPNYKELIK